MYRRGQKDFRRKMLTWRESDFRVWSMDTNTIVYLESQLPERLRFWLSDAKANNESVGDMGGLLIEALRNRYQWRDGDAVGLVNELLVAYDEDQRYFPAKRKS